MYQSFDENKQYAVILKKKDTNLVDLRKYFYLFFFKIHHLNFTLTLQNYSNILFKSYPFEQC